MELTREEISLINKKRKEELETRLKDLNQFYERLENSSSSFAFTQDSYKGPVEEVYRWCGDICSGLDAVIDEVQEMIDMLEDELEQYKDTEE